jgi:ABC-type transporter Mla subunit MlaD
MVAVDKAAEIKRQLAADRLTLRRLTLGLAGVAAAATAVFAGVAASAGKTSSGSSSPAAADVTDSAGADELGDGGDQFDDGFGGTANGFSDGAQAPLGSSGPPATVSGGS